MHPGAAATAVLTFMPQARSTSFARTTALLDQTGTQHPRCAHHADRRTAAASTPTWCSRTPAQPITDRAAHREIERQLERALQDRRDQRPRSRGARRARCACSPRRRRSASPTTPSNGRTIIELIAGDRPGLLSEVGQVFWTERVDVCTAQDHDRRRARRGRVLRDRRTRPAAGRGTRACAWRTHCTLALDLRESRPGLGTT